MTATPRSPQIFRFGSFQLDLRTGKLHKNGVGIKLQEQPLQILAALLERPGEVVTREELRQRLWPDDTFVDFEHGLNAAVNRLRYALHDSAESPRFIETLPRRGYRFMAPVESTSLVRPAGRRWGRAAGLGAAALVVLAVALILTTGQLQERLAGGGAPGPITSLVVLPLENLSGDPAQEPFVEGLTEELITQLGKLRALDRVISRHSAMHYKDTPKPLPQIARELEVDAVIEGSVLRVGDRVRINLQLVQADPERHLWAESYERNLRDVLAVHSEVARAVAGTIEFQLSQREQAELAGGRTVHPAAHEEYLLGRFHWNKRTEEGLRKAIEHFNRALDLDPDYAAAYAGLADALVLLPYYSATEPTEPFQKAQVAARKALELDDTLAEARTSLAFIKQAHEWDWEGAEEEYRRALALNPNYAPAHHWYSEYLAYRLRLEESVAEAERARRLDPLSRIMNTHLAHMHYYARDYPRAIEGLQRALEMHPDDTGGRVLLAYAYVQNGQPEEAIAEAQACAESQPENPEYLAALALAYATAGRYTESRQQLDRLDALAGRIYVSPYYRAFVLTRLGEEEQALTWLERALEERSPWMGLLQVDPRLDPLRGNPRFQTLLRRLHLPG